MSIQPFAQSLLSDVRKRREEEERRLRKQRERNELVGLVGGLAVKIGNEALANKTVNFLNQEPVWNANQTQKLARNNAASLQSIKSSIESGGEGYQSGDVVGYAMATMRPEFEARAKEKMSDLYTNDFTQYNDLVTSEVQKLAKEWASEYNEAIVLADEIASKDDYRSMVALNAKKVKPNDIASYVSRGIANFLGGKSQEDIQNEALVAITEGRFAKNAEALNTFMSTYKSTGDMVRAYEFTDKVFPEEYFSPDKQETIVDKPDLQVVDGQLFAVTQRTKTNRRTGDVSSEVIFDKDEKNQPVPIIDTNDPQKSMMNMLKQKNDTFNYGVRAQQHFESPAYAGFLRSAKELGIRPESPRDLEEYNKAGELYYAWATVGNLKDATKATRERAFVDALSTGILATKIAQEQLSDLPEDEKRKRLSSLLINLFNVATSVSGQLGEESTVTPKIFDYQDLEQQSFIMDYPYISRQ